MSGEKPCPLCGDDSEYSSFLDLCAERANEIWRENEVKILVDMYKSMDFVQVVRCRDCKHHRFADRSRIFNDDRHNDSYCLRFVDGKRMEVEADGFCAWGERLEP